MKSLSIIDWVHIWFKQEYVVLSQCGGRHSGGGKPKAQPRGASQLIVFDFELP
jgi:hypothetical protein